MKKKLVLWMGVLFLAASPAVAFAVTGVTTSQCWDFDQQTSQFGILPSQSDNIFGQPIAIVQDVSGGSLSWSDGAWSGSEFKIILDIPNQPIDNPYKLLTINLKYQGDISFMWVADIDTGTLFTPVDDPTLGKDGNWKTFTQQWEFRPNPREEIVVIGFKAAQEVTGATVLAALDQICVDTICVPEPATLSIFAIGLALISIEKRKRKYKV
jgi:hypothetical protein